MGTEVTVLLVLLHRTNIRNRRLSDERQIAEVSAPAPARTLRPPPSVQLLVKIIAPTDGSVRRVSAVSDRSPTARGNTSIEHEV